MTICEAGVVWQKWLVVYLEMAFIGQEDERSQQRWWDQLRSRESEDPGPFSLSAPYVKCRRLYVDSVWSLCEDHRLAETTAHVATRYYERALPNLKEASEKLDAVVKLLPK